jgi:hypothetical protein
MDEYTMGDEYIIGQYNRCRDSYYKKNLFNRMKEKKKISIDKYYIFIWEEDSNVKDKI